MTASDLFKSVLVLGDGQLRDRQTALRAVLDRLATDGHIDPSLVVPFLQVAVERERLGTTAFEGVAFAVVRQRLLDVSSIAALAVCRKPFDYAAVDDKPVDLVILTITSPTRPGDHLRFLERASRMLKDAETSRRLRAARDESQIREALAGFGF